MFRRLFSIFSVKTAYAHCDIPCGIYDPHNAQIAAHTLFRMTDLLVDEKDLHKVTRLTQVKEEHGKILENELVTLMYDYFKNEHYEKYKDLEELFDDAVELSSKSRQNIDLKSVNELLEKVLKISEIFYDSKGVAHKRVKSVYPTELDVVVQN